MTMKNMKRRMVSKLAVLLVAVFCFSAAWVNASTLYLYQPKFAGNGTSTNLLGLSGATSNLLSVAGWKANYTVNGTVQKTTQGQTNEFVQGASALLTQISVSGNVMRNTNVLLWTENFAVANVDVQKLSEVMFYQQNTVITTIPRLALRIGGNWYVSVNTYPNVVANASERTTLTAANLAAMNFYSLTFVSGSSLVLGSSPVAFSTLSGNVDAAGLYYDTTSNGSGAYVRLKEFTVATSINTLTINGGGGSGSYSPGTQVAISANTTTSRTFVAWIGDTNVLSSNTVSTTVTMPTNEVTQLTATYDLTSLTVSSGTGGGLYTSGANVAITASNIPGKFFVAWIGATQYVASATSATTTVTVPVQDIALTAKYTLLYQPNVAGNSNSNSLGHGGVTTNYLLSNVSWKAHYTVNGTAQSTTQGQTNEFVQASASLLTQCIATDPLSSQKAILWTENFAVTNAGVQSLSEVMFYQQNMDTNTIPRLALRVGGNWYASVTTYPNMVTNAMERTILAATNNLAAMNFYPLNFIPGSSLVLDTGSSTAFSALSGAVNAAGLYYDDTGTNYVRLREFTVTTTASTLTVTGGSGSGSYNAGQQVAILANTTTSRNFAAWIGDTQCVDNVTSSNATVTMLSSTVSLTATYDLTSLTVNSGAGGGLYTSGQQAAITASDVPGKIFVAWTGATQYVASVTSATTTVTVPVQDVALTATYTAAILYRPNVAGNANANSLGHGGVTTNYLLSNVSWKAHYTVNGTAQPATQAQTNEFVQSTAALLTQCSIATDPLRSQKAILWTENFAVTNADVQSLSEVMFYLQNLDTNTMPRLALRVGGNWYASVAAYPNMVANAMERTTLEATNLAAMNFYSLAFTPGSSLVLDTGSSTAFSDLSGAVDAAGLYYDDTGTNYVRLREFTVQSAQYMLTVTGGTGGGVYIPAAQVAISAAAIAGKTFVAWTGSGTQNVASVSSASTTVTMPAQTIDLTATYTDTTYALTVTSGSGSASYTNGHQVAISATSIGGKTFVAWTGDTAYVDNASSASATVTMPAQAIALTATYVDTTYALTVTSGTGGGSYTNGHQVGISATVIGGKTFVAWTGDTAYLDNASSASATVTMPAQAVNLTATYTDTAYALTVTSGTGGGSYTNGQHVGITANAPANGYAFAKWTGDTQFVASASSASTTVTMPLQAVSVTATYIATEQYTTNATPVPYSWLAQYGITNNQDAAVLLDPDGDGLTTEQEYIAGTDPTNSASVLRAAQATRNVVTWTAQSNRTYSVYWSTNLVKGFALKQDNIMYPTNNFTNSTPDSRINHYQIKVRMQ